MKVPYKCDKDALSVNIKQWTWKQPCLDTWQKRVEGVNLKAEVHVSQGQSKGGVVQL